MKTLATTLLLILLVCLLALSQSPARAQGKYSVAGLDNDREVEQFFLSFKEALTKGGKMKIASLVHYPITVSLVSGRRTTIKTKADFLRRYQQIFHDEFKQAILKVQPGDLWCNYKGVTFNHGEIWFGGIIKNERRPEIYVIKIIAINGMSRS